MRRIFLLCVVILCIARYGAAQSGVGAIGGIVTDDSGAVLPGVMVTLINPGTVGGNQTATTDEQGRYQFSRLVPGTYGVRTELQGFRTVIRENVAVNADVTVRADATMAVGGIEEAVTVTGDAPLVDTTSALNQTVLDSEIISKLPSRTDAWAISRNVPGVVMSKYDVGGSEGFANSTVTLHGSSDSTQGAFSIDGMEISCGHSPGASACLYPDTQAFEEVNFVAGNAAAENARGGMVYNLVTRTGSNTYRGEYRFSGSNQHLQSNNITPELRKDLLAAVPPKALAANPDIEPGSKVLTIFNMPFNLSGPILQNKLWFVVTGDYGRLDQQVVGSYNPDGTQYIDDNMRRSVSGKVSWQVKPNHQLHFYELVVQKAAFHGPADNPNQFYESSVTAYQYPNVKRTHQVRWTGVLSTHAVLEVGGSLQEGPVIAPHRPEVKYGDVPTFDAVTQVNGVARPLYNWNPQYRAYQNSALSYTAGQHTMKIGYQYNRAYIHREIYSVSNYPSGLRAVFRDGVPDSVNTYNTPVNQVVTEDNHSIYAQDAWRLAQKLTVNAGIRLQRTTGLLGAACQPETPFIAGQCFPEQRNVPNFLDVAPRLAVIYDLFGNGRTAIKGSVNRYMNTAGVPYSERVSAIRATNDTRTWTDRNHDLLPQLDELGPSSGFNLGTTNHYADDIKRPYALEFSAEVEHQLPAGVALSLAYWRRGDRREVGSRNLAVPTSSYIPLTVIEKTSGREVTVYNLDPAYRGKFDTLWDNVPEMNTDYNGVDFTARKRMSNRWSMVGSLSYGQLKGDIYGSAADLNNPNYTFRHGLLPSDVTWAAKVLGSYELPWRITISGSGQRFSGFPETQTVSVSRDTVSLTQVTQSLVVEESGITRLPTVNLFDISVRKQIRSGHFNIEPVMDLYNIGNVNTTTRRLTQLGPTYGRVVSIIKARMVKFGVNVSF